MPPASLSQKIREALPLATEFEGVCFRIVNTQRAKSGEALSTEGSRIHGGRYNSKGEFGVLYLSCDEPTCLAEINYYLVVLNPDSLSAPAQLLVADQRTPQLGD